MGAGLERKGSAALQTTTEKLSSDDTGRGLRIRRNPRTFPPFRRFEGHLPAGKPDTWESASVGCPRNGPDPFAPPLTPGADDDHRDDEHPRGRNAGGCS